MQIQTDRDTQRAKDIKRQKRERETDRQRQRQRQRNKEIVRDAKQR